MYMRRLLLILCALASGLLHAQESVFTVLDSAHQPIPQAHILAFVKGLDQPLFAVTDGSGRGSIQFPSENRVLVQVSFVGYKTIEDSIYPGGMHKYLLTADPMSLKEIVLTAQYGPVTAQQSVFPVEVLSKKLMEQRAAFNLEQLLENRLNLQIRQDNAIGSTGMSLRGLGGENVKIMIDGVPLIGRLDGDLDLGQINLNNIERVEIVEGPVSVNYGTNALGGVINLITAKSPEDAFRASANAYYESVGVYNFDAALDVSAKGRSIGWSGGRNFFDGYSPGEESRDLQWNQKEQWFTDLHGGWKTGDLSWTLRSMPFLEEITDRGAINPQNRAFDTKFTTNRWVNSLQAQGKVGLGYVNAVAGYTHYNRVRNAYIIDMETLDQQLVADPSQQDTSVFESAMTRLTWSTQSPDRPFNLQFGWDVQLDWGSGPRIDGGYQEMADVAVFGGVKWESERWVLQPSVRYAYNSKYDAPLIPALNFKMDVREDVQLRGSYARGFRAPSLKELYLDFVDANHNVQGNADLTAEDAHSFNLSAVWSRSRERKAMELKPELFFNHINNRIQLIFVGPNPIDFANANVGTYQTSGGRISFKWEYHPEWTFQVGGGVTGVRMSEDGPLQAWNYTPETSAQWTYFNMMHQWSASLFYKYTGSSPQPVSDGFGGVTFQTLDAFHMLDFTLDKKLWKGKCQLSMGVKNALDVTNVQTLQSGGIHGGGGALPISWGRTVFAGLKFNLAKSFE